MLNPFTERLRRLTDLDDLDIQRLEQLCTLRTVSAHTDLIREGESSDHLHVVVDGWACRYRTLADGRRQFPALALPGDTCDLDRLYIDPLNYGIASLTSCLVATMPHGRMQAVLDEVPAIRQVFGWLLSVENAVASEWAVCLGRRSALERMAHLFCEVRARLTAIGLADEQTCELPLTQEEFSNLLGLSVVHVNRTLQAMRADNLIRLENRQLTIVDLEALSRLADFDPSYLHLEGYSDGKLACAGSLDI